MDIETRVSSGEQHYYSCGESSNHLQQHIASMNGDQSSSVLDEEQLEHYRLMAQIEANIRIRDNTGFDRDEYERQQQQELNNPNRRIRPRPVSFFSTVNPRPIPVLPEARIHPNSNHTSVASIIGGRGGGINGTMPSYSSSSQFSGAEAATVAASTAAVLHGSNSSGQRPEEPPLPPRRANRRFVENPRTPQVSEICDGIAVQLPDGTPVTTTTVMEESEEEVKQEEAEELLMNGARQRRASYFTTMNDADDPNHVVVDCWGCGCRLRVHRLASLVKCSRCLTVSPSIPKDR